MKEIGEKKCTYNLDSYMYFQKCHMYIKATKFKKVRLTNI